MTIDLRRFKQTFLDESREGLDAMERGLLSLEGGAADPETINTIFRAAHSIKGGAGTFGFGEIASVTHLLETLLDQMRSGKREISSGAVTVLLQSVDVLRDMLAAAQDDRPNDPARVGGLTDALQAILGVPSTAAAPAAAVVAAPSLPPRRAWNIHFAPHPGLLRSGNDPLLILSELGSLGDLGIRCDASALPDFSALEPADIHLKWDLALTTSATRREIAEVFAWVEGDCELTIEEQGPVAAAAPAAVGPPRRRASDKVEDRAAGTVPAAAAPGESSSIRVGVEKVDALINLVGELVITQAMLKQLSAHLDPTQNEKLLNGLSQLDRNTRDLQDAVMSVRMLPMDFVFSRFPRVVRDLAGKLGKKVRLKTEGEATELDKGVIEKIADPLNHLVRNSLDHGLETPEARVAAGKDECGTVTLKASHQSGHIVIEVSDDGRGLNREKLLKKAQEKDLPCSDAMSDAEVWNLIFAPGFSTAAQITDVSGRGVGMDVVKKNILALGGQVDITSREGLGMSVIIRLPLTLAILDGMSVAVGDEIFIVPLNCVVESLQPHPDDLKTISGSGRLLRVRGEYIPLYSLREIFGVGGPPLAETASTVVLMEAEGRKIAVWVDELVGQQQVVIKNLDTNYKRIAGVSGATIMGDGRVALIVDVGGLSRAVSLPKAA